MNLPVLYKQMRSCEISQLHTMQITARDVISCSRVRWDLGQPLEQSSHHRQFGQLPLYAPKRADEQIAPWVSIGLGLIRDNLMTSLVLTGNKLSYPDGAH